MNEASEDDYMSDAHPSDDEDVLREMYLTNMFQNLIADAINEHEDELKPVVEDLEQESFTIKPW